MTDIHERMMARALELAQRSLYLSDPNPRVGCVIARDGVIVAEGWTQRAGEAHAEVHALARADGPVAGADVYVTLEPCSHHGRTGPCAEALVEAGVGRVFAAMIDPNPRVAGAGVARLREAGIEVQVGLGEQASCRLNPGFIRGWGGPRPWVRVKLGASVDGRTATGGGDSQWITGSAARSDVQTWRARSSAVVTGIGTLLADDPSLDVRLDGDCRQPLRVVVDSDLRMPPGARTLGLAGQVLVATCSERPAPPGAEAMRLPREGGGVSLPALVEALAGRQCNEILVEAGARLSGAFLAAGLVDEVVLYLAPMVIGSAGRGMFELAGIDRLADAVTMEFVEIERLGADLRIVARPTIAESTQRENI